MIMWHPAKASRSSARIAPRIVLAAACLWMCLVAQVAMGAEMTSQSLLGRWAMRGIPVEAGDAMITVIQKTDGDQLKVIPPRDLANATGGAVVVAKTGDGKYASLPSQDAQVTLTFQSPHAAHLEILRDHRGEKANYSIDLVHLN